MTRYKLTYHERGQHYHVNVYAGPDPDHLAHTNSLCARKNGKTTSK
jgi:hypothetical protein